MKKVLGLTIAVVLVIGLVVGGTWAFFSDIETTPDVGYNTFQAGIIDLELTQTGTVVVDGSFTDMKPCQTGYLVITLTNPDGEYNNPMYVWKHIFDIDPATDRDENGITGPEQVYYEANGLLPDGKNDIDRYIHFDMWIEVDGIDGFNADGGDIMLIDEAEGWLLTENLVDFDEVDTYGTNGVTCYWIYLGMLEPGESMTIVQSFHLDGTVGNWAQSDALFFTEEFFALQTVGDITTDALPGTELPGHPGPLPTP